MATSIDQIQIDIIEEMSQLGDWMRRYEYLIKLGKEHVVDTSSLHKDEHAVPGCQSNVWMKTQFEDGRLHFEIDSESIIIKGIIVLLLKVFNNQPAQQIANTDAYFLQKTGLSERISPSKSNGLSVIINRIQESGRQLDKISNETVA
ncbi:MAG: SufE family protein [Candidatus Marinimicrobia bacterium]|nr:SufE family protein [Candidatus Neomarinimicrobiota bacterium]